MFARAARLGRENVTNLARNTVISATEGGVNLAIEAFARFSEAGGVPPEVRRRCQLALDEVLSNVVRHGLAGRSGDIHLGFRRTADQVVVEIEDPAPAFNPLELERPDVTAPLEHRQAGGLGIALIKDLMDDVWYE